MLKEKSLRYASKKNVEAYSHIDILQVLNQHKEQKDDHNVEIEEEEANYFEIAEPDEDVKNYETFEKLTSANLKTHQQSGEKRKDRDIGEVADVDLTSPKRARANISVEASPVSVGTKLSANSSRPQLASPQNVERNINADVEEVVSPSTSSGFFEAISGSLHTFWGVFSSATKKDTNRSENDNSVMRTMGTQVAADSLIMLSSNKANEDTHQIVASPPPAKNLQDEDDYDLLVRSPEDDSSRQRLSGKGRLRKSSSSRLSIDDDWQ